MIWFIHVMTRFEIASLRVQNDFSIEESILSKQFFRIFNFSISFHISWGNSTQFSSAWIWIFDLKCFDHLRFWQFSITSKYFLTNSTFKRFWVGQNQHWVLPINIFQNKYIILSATSLSLWYEKKFLKCELSAFMFFNFQN